MSALNLLNQPDTFGNYFQATPTPLPPIPYQQKNPSTIRYGVRDDGKQKQTYKYRKQPSRHRVVHPSRKQLSKPIIDDLTRDSNDSPSKGGNTINRKKNTNQIHERPQPTENRFELDDEIAQNEKHELNYNNIYKKLQATKHANEKSGNKVVDKDHNQHSIKSRFPSFSSSYSNVDSNVNNEVDENQDYYDEYYNGEYTDSYDTQNSPYQLSNSANDFSDNIYKKQFSKRFGESKSEQESTYTGSHPSTEEELQEMMKYDPYYAQYYYSKYRPQEEQGRFNDEEYEDPISKKIRNVRDNNSIFRQDGGDVGSFIQTAMTVFSVVSSLFGSNAGGGGGGALDVIGSLLGGGGGGSSSSSQSQKIDRISTDGVDEAISTINEASGTAATDDLDVAMGTLMAYSGKFLRQIGLWAFEHATQTSSDTFTQSAVPDRADIAAVLGGGSSSSSSGSGGVVTSSGKPYISTLSQPDLERLGLKAVSAGAKPEKLQQAFIQAQQNGDWTKLETLISGALGEDAIKDPSAGNPIAGISHLVSNFIGGIGNSPTKIGNNPPAASTGPSYSQVVQQPEVSETGGLLEKLSTVWNGDPNADPLTQGNIATRFVSTFGLQHEALALQAGVNSVIKTINSFLGEEDTSNSIQNKVGKPPTYSQPTGTQYSESHVEVPVKDPQPPWSNLLTSIPQTVGKLAIAAVKFVTPKAPANKSGVNKPGGRPGATVSEVRPLIDLEDPNTLTMGMLGVAAVTGLSYAVTSSFASEDSDDDDDNAESKTVPNLFELYGPEHFLTNFDSLDLKRSFDNIVSAKYNKHAERQRRRRRNVQISAKSYKFNQPLQHIVPSSIYSNNHNDKKASFR